MGGGEKRPLVEFTMMKQLRKNYALIPIVLVGAFGMGLCAFQITRTLTTSPDVSINRKGNPKPYENFIRDGKYVQYKYFSTMDYSKLGDHPDKPKDF